MKAHDYAGNEIIITYDLKRCIHAKKCVEGSSAAFDPNRRPWIDPDAVPAAEMAAIIHRCPTGALHYRANDRALTEKPDAANTIQTEPAGPLYVRGQIQIRKETGETVLKDVRVALCRCGASRNKPFCDNSHFAVEFDDPGKAAPTEDPLPDPGDGPLLIIPTIDGPLHAEGSLTILNADGAVIFAGNDSWLCRCGASANKPYCDGSHERVKFLSES